MDPDRIAVATACLHAAHDGSLGFPEIVGRLAAAGFEGYLVDYRDESQTYYLDGGDSVVLDMPSSAGAIPAAFDAARIGTLVRWAQAGGSDYSYQRFCEKAKAAGCAGYLVSFPGRRVVYFGRTAETHVEHFPDESGVPPKPS
ncbi:conserved protein of unknown function [Magnetospirillum sp. XM-1]|uniref:DUF1398 domain-containing protein n=1 Tax=Magnetospirillum sp. XM-1 TaxID=1663591 RepID=UPI00073DDA9E|nr:DUF1398 family protein [Magnetospirillum sp. XM-1]CUW37623.1 conserved protein of unknown function [Magnetospirillum sp. XM-1]